MVPKRLSGFVEGRLRLWLLIGLIGTFVISLALTGRADWSAFWLNLSAGIVGIAVTVFIVDFLVRRDLDERQARWVRPAIASADERLRDFTSDLLARCVAALDWIDLRGEPVMGEYLKYYERHPSSILMERAWNISEPLQERAEEILSRFEKRDWQRLSGHLKVIRDDSRWMIIAFGSHLSPPRFAQICDIERISSKLIFACDDAADFVEEHRLAQRRTSP
jgi:hypothetical protein